MAKTGPNRIEAALMAAGIADRQTRRVVIDMQAGYLPVVYIEKYGDDRVINIIEAVGSVQTTKTPRQQDTTESRSKDT